MAAHNTSKLFVLDYRELAAWNGIYFVLNSRLDLAPRAFNVRGQWASLARAPVDSLFLQPLSQQALALALPSRGDY